MVANNCGVVERTHFNPFINLKTKLGKWLDAGFMLSACSVCCFYTMFIMIFSEHFESEYTATCGTSETSCNSDLGQCRLFSVLCFCGAIAFNIVLFCLVSPKIHCQSKEEKEEEKKHSVIATDSPAKNGPVFTI